MSLYPALSTWDLRLRSLDPRPGDPVSLCSECGVAAKWSVWLHTPEWGANGGLTRVLCTEDALSLLTETARDRATPPTRKGSQR